MNSARPRIGVAALIRRGDAILLGRRLSGHGAGAWQTPGGHLETGESIAECAHRETYEETGLRLGELTVGPYTDDRFDATTHYVTLWMLAVDPGGQPTAREPEKCAAWEWHPWQQLPQPLFLPLANLLASGFAPARQPRFRAIHPSEHAAISALAARSKASWGYGAELMLHFAADLTLAPQSIARGRTVGMEINGALVGYTRLIPREGDTIELEDLFVDAPFLRRGYGLALFEEARAYARDAGFATMRIVADPNAAGFYAARGAAQVGILESTLVPGRTLPIFTLALTG